MGSLQVISSPGQEPITLAEARAHLRTPKSDTAEDAVIQSLITVAREEFEEITHRQVMPVTLEYQMDDFWETKLPGPPFQVIDSVKYDNTADVETTLSAANYHINESREPAMFIRADGVTWPETKVRKPNSVRIRYSAGYGLAFTASGATITATGHNYQDGQKVRVFTSNSDLPLLLETGTDYWIVSAAANTFSLSASYGGAAITTTDAGTGVHWVTHIPEKIKQNILVRLTDYWEQAQASTVTGHIVSEIPKILERLTNPYIVYASP